MSRGNIKTAQAEAAQLATDSGRAQGVALHALLRDHSNRNITALLAYPTPARGENLGYWRNNND